MAKKFSESERLFRFGGCNFVQFSRLAEWQANSQVVTTRVLLLLLLLSYHRAQRYYNTLKHAHKQTHARLISYHYNYSYNYNYNLENITANVSQAHKIESNSHRKLGLRLQAHRTQNTEYRLNLAECKSSCKSYAEACVQGLRLRLAFEACI